MPVLSVVSSPFPGGHGILQRSLALNQIGGVFEKKKVQVPFVGRMKACDPPNFVVVVSDLHRTGLINCRQMDQIDCGAWCDRIVGVQTSGLSESSIFLKLDNEVLG